MKFHRIVLLTLALLCGASAFAQTPDTAAARTTLIPTGRIHKNQLIESLYRQLDSLQKAYDSLYVEYQSSLQPVNVNDDDDLIQN